MIECLYDCFKHWAEKGSVYIMSDPHFDDKDTKLMNPDWISSEEQVSIINKTCPKGNTLILLGDIGNPEWVKKIKAKKILISGNHDAITKYKELFDEIYDGILMIAPKILLSHEPVFGIPFAVNIHGHCHNGEYEYLDEFGCKHINLAADVCGYAPINLGKEIKNGLISQIPHIHRITIDKANENPIHKKAVE